MKKILVTGANGQLGSCIQETVNRNPNELLQFRFEDSNGLDITNAEQVAEYFNQNTFHYVVNCAAYTAVDKAESEPERAYEVNAIGVKNIAIACKKHNSVLIHISTDYVFDGEKIGAYTIHDSTNPKNVYGKTKLEGEEFAFEIHPKTFVIRTSWVYSEYGNNFVKTMRRLFQEKEELSIVNDQIGKPTNALRLAEKILELIHTENTNFGLYHYASDEAMTWYEFAVKIKEQMQSNIMLKPIATSEFPTAAKRPKNSVLEVNL